MAGEMGEGQSNPVKGSCEYSADPSLSCRRQEIQCAGYSITSLRHCIHVVIAFTITVFQF